jgi:FlaA1/EpsC-like NDP-sugar epimerase
MLQYLRNRFFLALDILLLPLAVYLAFMLRTDDVGIANYGLTCIELAALSAVIIPAVFIITTVYNRYWPFASLDELLLLCGATVAGVGASVIAASLVNSLLPVPAPYMPRSIPFLFALLALVATAFPRVIVRTISYRRHWQRSTEESQHVFIMGAGEAGSLIAQELRSHPQLNMEVVGFIDDDDAKRGLRIHGVPVLGNRFEIPRYALRYDVHQVIIALPSAPGTIIREVIKICSEAHLQARTMPGMYELLGGKVSISQLRKVEIEDLLRREPVRTDATAVKALLRGQRVLVTGGGGSIGSELCRQVLLCQPSELVVVGHGENSVFEIENELKRYLAAHNIVNCRVSSAIADVRMPDRLQAVFNEYRPQIVFHAAAHKHVPLMELNPSEAVTNNVVGTRNVLDACLRAGVQHFVMISTDKAVNPTNVMGASKRAAELLVLQAARTSGRPYVAVRFGNVLGSRGSVVLTFRQQIAAGGPVTVTHPDMRRFFMTIPEAVQLVLQAAVLGQGGEVFTLDMGQPVKLVDLATDMIRLSGLEPGRDIEIQFSGIRPGEKLYEELFLKDEEYSRTAHDKIFIACNASKFVPERLNDLVRDLEAAAHQGDPQIVISTFRRLIPEYQPSLKTPVLAPGNVMPMPVSPVPTPRPAGPVTLASPLGGSE